MRKTDARRLDHKGLRGAKDKRCQGGSVWSKSGRSGSSFRCSTIYNIQLAVEIHYREGLKNLKRRGRGGLW